MTHAKPPESWGDRACLGDLVLWYALADVGAAGVSS